MTKLIKGKPINIYHAEYYKNNKSKKAEYYKKNKVKIIEQQAIYRRKNKNKLAESRRNHHEIKTFKYKKL